MKNLLRNILLAMTLVTFFNVTTVRSQVVAYKTNNFTGEKLEINEDWRSGGGQPWNDAIRSIKVPAGWKIIVYEHGFSGRSFEATKDWNGPTPFAISSIKIVQKSSPKVVVYKTTNFTGESLEISEDWRSGGGQPWNDVIKSIKVPAGWKIIVYENGFSGKSFETTKDWTGPAPFEISSIKIVEKK